MLRLEDSTVMFNGTVGCWIREKLGWLSGPEWVDCMHVGTTLDWTIVGIKVSAVALVAMIGFLYWKAYRVPPILVRVLIADVCLGLLLNTLT